MLLPGTPCFLPSLPGLHICTHCFERLRTACCLGSRGQVQRQEEHHFRETPQQTRYDNNRRDGGPWCPFKVGAAAGAVTLPLAFGVGRGLEPKRVPPSCISAPAGCHFLEALCSALQAHSNSSVTAKTFMETTVDQGGEKLHEKSSWYHRETCS